MGKAGRRKRNRPSAAPGERSAAGAARSRRRRLTLTAAAAGVLALGLVLAFGLGHRDRDGRDGPVPQAPDAPEKPEARRAPRAASGSSFVLPNPDTSAMTPPVARAIREARAVALASPGSAAALGRLGEVFQAHWLHDEAVACYERAGELAPGEPRWAYLLASVEDIRGADGERIDELFREAIRLVPGYPPAHVRHADALMRLGRWSEARDAYRKAVELDPKLVLAHRGLGQALVLLGDGPSAVDQLEQAARLAPGDRIAQVALARAYALVDRPEQAAEAARKAQTLTGEAPLPDQIFFEMQNLAVDPESLRSRISRSLNKGDVDAALEALALLEESEGAGARKQLAASVKRRANQLAFGGEFDAALREFERAARLAPADPEIEHNWGTVLLRRGDLNAAQTHFERAIELEPRSADSLYNLGVVLEGLGRADEAIERFRAAAAIQPQHPAAKRLAELGGG